MRVELPRAQELFDSLPAELRWPTLSPAYVAADASRDPMATPLFLVAHYEDGVLMHCLHEARIPGTDGCDWQSAYGYGGPLVHNLDSKALAQAWRQLDSDIAPRRVVAEFVRFHPVAGNHRFYPGVVRRDRSVVAVDLTTPDLMSSYSGRARSAIRKAERSGLRATSETLVDALGIFPDFYRRCMREIGAHDFYLFSDAYFENLSRLPGARVLTIHRDDDRLSMGLFLFGPKQAEYHLSGSPHASRQSGATNLLLHAAAQTAKSAGCLVLYLGGGTSARLDDPLLRFKASFAPPSLGFHVGHRIHDPAAYAHLREGAVEATPHSDRVLFYRR